MIKVFKTQLQVRKGGVQWCQPKVHLTSFSFSHIFNMYLCHIMGLTADFFSYVLLSQCTCTLRHGYIISLKSNLPSHIILFFILKMYLCHIMGLTTDVLLSQCTPRHGYITSPKLSLPLFASRESFNSKVQKLKLLQR